jgi:hypothetical protein
VTDSNQTAAQQRDAYLQMMIKARQLNDQGLARLIVKKMANLGMSGASTTTSGCHVIPFPVVHSCEMNLETEPPMWWVLVKLTLLIPGSLTALLLLSKYTYQSSWVLTK